MVYFLCQNTESKKNKKTFPVPRLEAGAGQWGRRGVLEGYQDNHSHLPLSVLGFILQMVGLLRQMVRRFLL